MHSCPKCGYCEKKEVDLSHDDEISAKDEVLKELIDMLKGSMGDSLPKEKPVAMSLEMLSAKEDDEDEEKY